MKDTLHRRESELPQEYWYDVLGSVFRDKKVILAGEVVVGLIPRARQIRELGAESTFMLAAEGVGTGELPSGADGPWLALESRIDGDIIEVMHESQRILGHLPPEAMVALDDYDPDCQAMVVGNFLHEQPTVGGRPSLAYRKPEWLALDDKTIIDALWDTVGVTREASSVVAVDREAIMMAMQAHDRGDGVVLSGDSREGVSGGAIGTRWVRTEEDIDRALTYYSEHCDRLRVMPFLEGIPCSIHGMVFSDYTAAFRPVEMMTLRKPASGEFFYAGTATYWDPNSADRDYMRELAKHVGDALRDMVRYRGIFTIDGVMTKNGFRPTELNPRAGAGIKPLLASMPDFPLELIAQATIASDELDVRPQALEALVLETADDGRGGGTWAAVRAELPVIEGRGASYHDEKWEWDDSDMPDATVTTGSGTIGSFVRLTPVTSRFATGDSFAPVARAFWQFLDEELQAGIGPLDVAQGMHREK